MFNALVFLVVIGIAVALVFWLMDYLPVPEPLNRWIKVAAMIIGVIAVVMVLLNLTGTDIGLRRP